MKSLSNLAAMGLALVLGAGVATAQNPYGQSGSSRSQTSNRSQTTTTEKHAKTEKNMSRTTGGDVQFFVGPMAIQQVQQRLSAAGFNPGATDGSWNESTRSAVREFQSQRGIPATGDIDLHTLALLGVDLNQIETQNPENFRMGSTGTGNTRYGSQGTQRSQSNRSDMGDMSNRQDMNNPQSGSTGSQSQSSHYGSSSSSSMGSMGSQTSMTSEREGAPLFAGPMLMQQVVQKLGENRYGTSGKATKSSKHKDKSGTETTYGSAGGLSAMSSPSEIRQVLTQFQRAKGLPATGELTFQTLDKLGINLNDFAKVENTGQTGGTYGSRGSTGSQGNMSSMGNEPNQSTNQAYDQSRTGSSPNNPPETKTNPSGTSSTSGRYGRGGESGMMQTPESSMSMPIYVGTSVVRKVQEALGKSGQNVAQSNGQWGPETRRAISDFQKAKGLPVTGNINLETLHALGVADDLKDLAHIS